MTVQRVLAVALFLVLAGCATSFSPDRSRSEITSQTGADPHGVFEFTLGPTTLALILAARLRYFWTGKYSSKI